jgi:hypothetical protein
VDSGVTVLLRETEDIIADHLSRGDVRETKIMRALDGVPRAVILEAADRLGVVVSRGAWRVRWRASREAPTEPARAGSPFPAVSAPVPSPTLLRADSWRQRKSER